MTVPILPDVERRTAYSPVASAGPFDVGFDIWGDGTDYESWVRVYLDGVELVAVTDWTMDSPSGSFATMARPIQDARITLAEAATGALVIIGEMRPRRTSQVAEGRGVSASDYNILATKFMATAREGYDRIGRLEAQVATQIGDPTIATKAVRVDAVQTFNESEQSVGRSNIDALKTKYLPSLPNAVERPYIQKFGQRVSLRDFLAGSTDFQVEIGSELADVYDWMNAGNRCLEIPAGEYLLTDVARAGAQAFLIDADNISLIGVGAPTCILKCGDGAEVGVLGMGNSDGDGAHNILIRGITLDGNSANNSTSGLHAFRAGNDIEHLTIENLRSLNSQGYGLGFETSSSGVDSFRHIRLDDIFVYNCSNDGIDSKNPNGTNEDWQLSNIAILDFCRSGLTAEIAGIDCRQPTQLSNILVKCTDRNDISLVRFRSGTGGNEGKRSTITNFKLIGSTDPANVGADTLNVGLDIEASQCKATNGTVITCDQGVSIGANAECEVAKVTADGCNVGFRSISGGDGYGSAFEGCTAINSVAADTEFGGETRMANCAWKKDGHNIIFGQQTASGFTGFKWIADDVFGWYLDGVVQSRFEITGRMNLSALAATDFANPGKLLLAAGSSQYATSYRANSTLERLVASFENLTGVKNSLRISDADGLFVADPAGTKIMSFPPTFSQLGAKPTTIAGFGITDAISPTGTATLTNKTLDGATLATKLVKGIYVLGAGSNIAHTGDTNEFAYATIPVPAGVMGSNGQIRIWSLWSCNALTANGKLIRHRFGASGAGVGGSSLGTLLNSASFLTASYEQTIVNVASASSQVVNGAQAAGGFGVSSTDALVTTAINTANAAEIVLCGTLTNAGETLTLRAYRVELVLP